MNDVLPAEGCSFGAKLVDVDGYIKGTGAFGARANASGGLDFTVDVNKPNGIGSCAAGRFGYDVHCVGSL